MIETTDEKSQKRKAEERPNDENDEAKKKERTYHRLSNLLYKKSRPSSSAGKSAPSVSSPQETHLDLPSNHKTEKSYDTANVNYICNIKYC